MQKLTLTLALVATLSASLTGCANMTDEQRAALGGAIVGGLAVAGAVAAARSAPVYVQQPVYVQPMPVTTTCRRYGNSVSCSTW